MRLNRIALAALVCVALFPSMASAQDDAFKRGLKAKDDKNWAEAARQMRLAIQSDPMESMRKVKTNAVLGVFGAKESEYLPRFFLGEALLNQKDCVGAVTEWSTSLDQHAVQSKADYRLIIERGFKECAAKGVLLPAEFEAQWKVSRQAYIDANAMAKRITDLGGTHRDQWLPLASQYDEPRRELENASTRLTAASKTRSASDFGESKAASERAMLKLKPLEDALNAAIESVASLQQRVRDVNDAIASADALDKSIDGKGTLTESMAMTRKSGRDQLAQGRDRLAAGQKTQNLATVNEAGKAVQGAAGLFTQLLEQLKKVQRAEFDQRFGVAVRSTDEALASISALMTTFDDRAAQTPDKVTPDISTQRDAIRKQIEGQRQRYERARRAEDVAGIDAVRNQIVETQTALNTIIQAFGPLSLRDRGVHAGLEEGARLFLAGDYQKALAALDPSTGVDAAPSPSLQLQAHLFRAASLFALYVRSGESKKELRTQALAEIDLCKQIDATFQPTTQAFAPRFITLYKTGGAAAQTAAVTQ
jgi:hypothetical protein